MTEFRVSPTDAKHTPTHWPVLEIFGPTIQGEGALAGRKSHFIRLAICNDRCSWCDTKYSWNRKEAKELTLEDILDEVRLLPNAPWVTISGGNPGIWPNLGVMIDALHLNGFEVNVETQGTVFQNWMSWTFYGSPDILTVSPKPPSANVRFRPHIFEKILQQVPYGQIVIKVVIFNETDYQWFRDYIWNQYKSDLPVPMYLQAGTVQKDIEALGIAGQQLRVCGSYEWLCNRVLQDAELQDVIVLPQLHVLAFGHKRSA